MKEQPWHAEALRMQAEGATWNEIARAVDRSLTTIAKLFRPEYHAAQVAAITARRKERYRSDPAYRDSVSRYNKRQRIRRNARAEAAETGRPVEEVYAAWGVS